MSPTFVIARIRRASLELLGAQLLLLVVAVGVCVANRDRYWTLLNGAWPLDAASITRAETSKDLAHTSYVQVRGTDAVEVGEERARGSSQKVLSKYFLITVDQRLLLVKASPAATGPIYTGSIRTMEAKVRDDLFAALRKDNREVIRSVLPLMLDATDSPLWGWGGVLLLTACVPVALWKIAQAVLRFRDPALHPAWKALSVYGAPRANANAIESEVGRGMEIGKAHITASWLLHSSPFAFNAVPLAEVLWFYKHVTKHSTNFIPTGRTYAIVVHTRRGKKVTINGSQATVDQLLEEIHTRAPWAIVGYTAEIEEAMSRAPERAQLVKDADERRRQAKAAESLSAAVVAA